MHHSLVVLAHYNQTVNAALLNSITPLSSEQLHKESGVYFKSIIGILNHILNSDMQWLTILSTSFPDTASITDQCPKFEVNDFMAIPFPDMESFRPQRIAMDTYLVQFINALSPERVMEYFTHSDWQGREHTLRIGSVLLHLFNHQTHHRGQVTALLDQYGIENDWSNLVFMLDSIDPRTHAQ